MINEWLIAKIELPVADAEMASYLLYELGCNGILEEESDKGNCRFIAYFDAGLFNKINVSDYLDRSFESSNIEPSIFEVYAGDVDDWKDEWRQWFKPFEIINNIIVAPSWENYKRESGESVITMDPGMAFGTGLHGTTRVCAAAIEEFADEFSNPSLLDVGTGSGLLALVARKLGFKTIKTVENDPDSILVARENFVRNGAADIEVLDDIKDIGGEFDIIVANILLSVLIEIKEGLISRVARNGYLILSGITHEQEEQIISEITPALELIGNRWREEWSAVIFKR